MVHTCRYQPLLINARRVCCALYLKRCMRFAVAGGGGVKALSVAVDCEIERPERRPQTGARPLALSAASVCDDSHFVARVELPACSHSKHA